MLYRRRAGVMMLGVTFTIASALASCFDFGDLSGGSTDNDAGGNDTGTSDTSMGDDAIGELDSGRAEPSIKLAAGGDTTCAIQGGVVKCWGDNYSGELGHEPHGGTDAIPTSVVLSFTPTMIATSGAQTCASDGTHTSCWGDNEYSELGQDLSVDAGCDLVSLCCPTPLSIDLGTINAIATGSQFTCFIPGDGGVRCLGQDTYDTLGDPSGNPSASPETISGVTNAADLGTGEFSACARESDGSVWCWGDNTNGDLGSQTSDAAPGSDPHPIPLRVAGLTARQISAGPRDSCATLSDNTVSCWGANSVYPHKRAGQLGHNPSTDPTCYGGVACDPIPMPVAGLMNAREVSAGDLATCAVRTDDSVVCWGDNSTGLLSSAPNVGDGGDPYNFTPQVMPGLTNVAHIVMGEGHACAVTWDDHVFCWGANASGQLGVPSDGGATTFYSTPVTPQGF